MCPNISVVIPTYNRAHLIEKAIKSVLNQSYQDFEIIVVDDASIDNTSEVIQNIHNRSQIRYLHHDKNKGGSAARNTGIRATQGRYIAFLDSDDDWLPEKLEEQVKIIQNGSNVIYTGFALIDIITEKVLKEFWPNFRGYIFEDLLYKNYVGTTSTVMIMRECFEKVGYFDESLPSCQDWDMWIRLSRIFSFDYVPKVLVRYRYHKQSISGDGNSTLLGRIKLHDKILPDLESRRYVHSWYHFGTGAAYCYIGEMRKGRQELEKSIRINPKNLSSITHFLISLLGHKIYFKTWRLMFPMYRAK